MSQAQADYSARFLLLQPESVEKMLQEAARDLGQSRSSQLRGVPPTALHQEPELFMKSPVTSLEMELFLPMAAAEHPGCTQPPTLRYQGPFGQHPPGPGATQTSRAHLTPWAGATFSHSEKKEMAKEKSICQRPLNELLQTAQPRYQ